MRSSEAHSPTDLRNLSIMYADITKPPAPLPAPQLKHIRPGILLLPPLSRRGHGPGLILLAHSSADPLRIDQGVPSELIKWAEEGYTVVKLDLNAFEGTDSIDVLNEAVGALNQCEKCDKGKIGLVGMSNIAPRCWSNILKHMLRNSGIEWHLACHRPQMSFLLLCMGMKPAPKALLLLQFRSSDTWLGKESLPLAKLHDLSIIIQRLRATLLPRRSMSTFLIHWSPCLIREISSFSNLEWKDHTLTSKQFGRNTPITSLLTGLWSTP